VSMARGTTGIIRQEGQWLLRAELPGPSALALRVTGRHRTPGACRLYLFHTEPRRTLYRAEGSVRRRMAFQVEVRDEAAAGRSKA
jgi:hypothetical protein